MLQLIQELKQRPEQKLILRSDYLSTCLPLSERYVQAHLRQVLNSWKWVYTCCGSPYNSIMDMLLCNTCPHLKRNCRRFYDGRGKPFIELYPQWLVSKHDESLLSELQRLVRIVKGSY